MPPNGKKKVEAVRQTSEKQNFKPDVDTNKISTSTPIQSQLTPYAIFERCIKRARNLISFHKGEESENAEHFLDAYRAAIVLSISALDAFVRSLVAEKIKEALVDNTKPLQPKLAEYIKGLLNQDKLLEAARKGSLHELVDIHIKADFSTKSFQGDWRIKTQMELVGYPNVFKDISKAANKNEQNIISTIKGLTDRRHIIAHAGDYDLDAVPQTENNIDKKYASDGIDFVCEFAHYLNEICKKK